MGDVVPIGKLLESELLAACDEMRARVLNGEINSLLALVQLQGDPKPRMVLLGRFKADPYRALTALERGRIAVHRALGSDPATDDFTVSRRST